MKRYGFPATCPYCGNSSVWLFAANKIGQRLVDCEHCGKTYVIEMGLVPRTQRVFSLKEKAD